MAEYFFPKKVRIQHPANVFTWYGPGKIDITDESLMATNLLSMVARKVPLDGKVPLTQNSPLDEENLLAGSLPVKPVDPAEQAAKDAEAKAAMLKPTKSSSK